MPMKYDSRPDAIKTAGPDFGRILEALTKRVVFTGLCKRPVYMIAGQTWGLYPSFESLPVLPGCESWLGTVGA